MSDRQALASPYGFTHTDPCIEFGHCYHHIERLGLMTCCVCHLYRDTDDERENDCGI